MSASVACLFVFAGRPRRFDTGCSPLLPTEYDADRFVSLPEDRFVAVFANGLDAMRFGVSSFLRFEDRGESSMAGCEVFRVFKSMRI
jgi:hypothetical protein